MLDAADKETEIGVVETLSLEFPCRLRPTSGRTRSLYWKLCSKTSSLNLFFGERMLVKKVHFFCLGVGMDDVTSEPESLVLKTEESLRVIEISGIEPGCDPTSPLDILNHGRLVSLIKEIS